jgi:hypothetical protein
MDFREWGGKGFKIFVGRIPPWQYVAAALVLAVAGHFLSEVEILAPLRALTAALLADLQRMNPVSAIGEYYRNLYSAAACGVSLTAHKVECNLGQHMANWGFSDWLKNSILLPLIMLYEVALDVWRDSSLLGRGIYLATFPMGIGAAFAAVLATGDDWIDEWTPFGWAMFALLTAPAVAFAALVLQGWLFIVLWLFGKALAAIVWFTTVIAAPLAYFNHAMHVVKGARELEEGHSVVKGKE